MGFTEEKNFRPQEAEDQQEIAMSEQDAAGQPAEGAETTAAQDTGSTAKPDAGDKGSNAKPAGEDKSGKEAKPGILDGKEFEIGLPGGGTKTVKGDQPMEDPESEEKIKAENADPEGDGKEIKPEKSEKEKDPDKKAGESGPQKPEEVKSDLIKDDDPKGFKTRIGKSVLAKNVALAERDEARSETVNVRAELDEANKKLAERGKGDAEPDKKGDADPDKPVKPVKPVEGDFEDYEKFEAAREAYFDAREDYSEKHTDWKVKEATDALKATQEAEKKEAADKLQADAVKEQKEKDALKVAAGEVQYEDFQEVAMASGLQYSQTMADEVYDSDNFAELSYHLGKNPDELVRIKALDPNSQIRELTKIDMQLRADGKKPTTTAGEEKSKKELAGKRTTTADSPIKTVSSAGEAAAFDPKTADVASLANHLNAATLARRKSGE